MTRKNICLLKDIALVLMLAACITIFVYSVSGCSVRPKMAVSAKADIRAELAAVHDELEQDVAASRDAIISNGVNGTTLAWAFGFYLFASKGANILHYWIAKKLNGKDNNKQP